MFPYLVKQAATAKPTRLRTEKSFTSEDPWNQYRRTEFHIDSYALLIGAMASRYKMSRDLGVEMKLSKRLPILYGIRSEIDGVERMLPWSLGFLWRTGCLPEEALPRLLIEIQPMLRRMDFMQDSRRDARTSKRLTVGLYLAAGLFALLLLGGTWGVTSDEGVKSGLFFLALLGPICAGLWFLLRLLGLRSMKRQQRQVEWVLSHK